VGHSGGLGGEIGAGAGIVVDSMVAL
jgi:hypothetical protein